MKSIRDGRWAAHLHLGSRPRAAAEAPIAPSGVRHAGWARDRSEYLTARLDSLAVELAARPLRALLAVLALNLGLAACFVGAGYPIGDQALLFRELAPGTWLSFAELCLIAATALAVHERAGTGRRDFWAVSALVFGVFAFDEITQAGQFLAKWLSADGGLAPTGGFNDVDSILLTLLFAGAALVLAPRALVLREHPRALALLTIGALLGAASQTLDSFVVGSKWEFVAEESLKLGAEAFLFGGFLAALHDVAGARRATARQRRGGAEAAGA